MNSKRFLSAYNKIDRKLRSIYDLPPNMSFTEAVRRSAGKSALIRKYEDDLIDYARLRNAIVHNSDTDMVIAEPHLRVVEEMEHICELLSRPPLCTGYYKSPVSADYEVKLSDAVRLMTKNNISNLPVTKNGRIAGVATNKYIVEYLSRHFREDLNSVVATASIGDTLCSTSEHYLIFSKKASVIDALTAFSDNPKLQLIMFTETGDANGRLSGVLSTGDIMRLNRIMEDFD